MTNRNKSNPAANEKRLSPRRKFEMEGTLNSLTEGVQHPDHRVLTRNISVDGVYLWSDAVLAVDERVKLQLRLPSSEKSQMQDLVDFFGTVVRTERLPDGKVGLAIRLHGARRLSID